MNSDLLDIRSFSAFDDQMLICVDDRTHRRLIEGVAAQLGLQRTLRYQHCRRQAGLHFFAALTQFEKELIRERTMAGLSSARARGRRGGRKKLLTTQQTRVVKTMWDSHEHTRHEISAHFTVSIATIDRVLRASRGVAASRGGK